MENSLYDEDGDGDGDEGNIKVNARIIFLSFGISLTLYKHNHIDHRAPR